MYSFANSSRTWRLSVIAAVRHVFRWTGFCLFLALLALPFFGVTTSQAAQVTLQWEAISDAGPAGYRVYSRTSDQNYNYAAPAWQGQEPCCTIGGLSDGTTYYFVVRAVDQSNEEKGDSNEVSVIPTDEQTSAATGSVNEVDETATSDPADVTGDSQASNPFPPAESVDITTETSGDDSDGIVPETPEITLPAQEIEQVSTEPDLFTSDFASGSGNDGHAYTRWLIFRDSDNLCIYDQTSEVCLTKMTVPPLVLEGGTRYYWTAMHYGRSGAVSQPANNSSFKTVEREGDLNSDGIPDSQELTTESDLDHNGLADEAQEDMKCFWDAYGTQEIGVKLTTGWPKDQLVAVQPVDPMAIATPSGLQPDMPGGLINFKLQLDATSTSAIVSIYYSDSVSDAMYWLVFDPAQGYLDYGENTSVSSDRRTVTLYLEDGEPGDMDGVANGVIVTMAGYGYAGAYTELSSLSGSAASQSNDDWQWDFGASCFINSLLIE